MAIYLGELKVSPSLLNTITRTITLDAGGNVISDTTQETVVTHEDSSNLTEDLPVVKEWIRPAAWPDIDSLPVLAEGLYLTYDNTDTVDYKLASFYITTINAGDVIIAQGHIDGSNFILDATWTVASDTVQAIDYSSSNYNYIIFKITPAADGHITRFYFNNISPTTTGTLAAKRPETLRCLERRGWLPMFRNFPVTSNTTLRTYCTEWMERDCVEFGDDVHDLSYLWYLGRGLKKIEFGNWTGENCLIISLAYTFAHCNTIEKIDLSLWITTGWQVESLQNMFQNCFNMKICKVPFDTIHWGFGSNRTLSLSGTWNYCRTMENLDLSSWNMTGINVTILNSTWSNCHNLKSLNVKNWDTSSWVVNSLSSTFYACHRLVDIDLSNWDTSKWTPTTMYGMFNENYSRRNFNDIKYWNTSKWKITNLQYTFYSCLTVQELDLSNWDVSGWAVTSLYYTFANMRNVKHIRVGTWDTTNWEVSDMRFLFYLNFNLEELECTNWNTANWHITYGPLQMFGYCTQIKEANFASWDTTNWSLSANSDLRYWFRNCINIKKINVSNFNISAVNNLTYYAGSTTGDRALSPFYGCNLLEELTLPQGYKGHIDMSYIYKMSRPEIIKVFNELDTAISDTAKVWIGNIRYKLTTADIAIVTNKGYTVVQA